MSSPSSPTVYNPSPCASRSPLELAVDEAGKDVLIITGPRGTRTIAAGDFTALGDAVDAVVN